MNQDTPEPAVLVQPNDVLRVLGELLQEAAYACATAGTLPAPELAAIGALWDVARRLEQYDQSNIRVVNLLEQLYTVILDEPLEHRQLLQMCFRQMSHMRGAVDKDTYRGSRDSCVLL